MLIENGINILAPIDQILLVQVQKMAINYGKPHNIFGTKKAPLYVKMLNNRFSIQSKEGWFGIVRNGIVLCTAHLSIYGKGNGHHQLWKIRHLLFHREQRNLLPGFLLMLCDHIKNNIFSSGKIVIFLDENETEIISAAEQIQMKKEAAFKDYYRLGETCYVFSTTVVNNDHEEL